MNDIYTQEAYTESSSSSSSPRVIKPPSTSKGYLTIVDGGISPPPETSSNKGLMGFVRMGDTLVPSQNRSFKTTRPSFVVDLHYSATAHTISNHKVYASGLTTSYSKNFRRLASGGNLVGDAVNFVSQFSGCDEAKKLRGRIIALSRLKKTISGEVFKFPVEAP